MERKFLFLSITLITIMGFFGPSLVSAASIESDSEYWTLEEMAELSEASFAEAKELCEGSNRGCWQKYLRDRRSRGGIYEALDSYEYPKLIITSVNPTSGKIKLIYYNENKRSRYLGKEEDPATLYSIYIGRIEGESDINYSPWSDIENVINNRETARNIYMTFRWNSEDENHVELLPNVEQEFDAENLELATNINNSFYYILEDSNSRYLELYRLSDCLANYQEGTECQIRYSSKGVVYVQAPVNADRQSITSSEDRSTAAEEIVELATNIASTPNTGTLTRGQAEISEISPETTVLMLFGSAIVVWNIARKRHFFRKRC